MQKDLQIEAKHRREEVAENLKQQLREDARLMSQITCDAECRAEADAFDLSTQCRGQRGNRRQGYNMKL